MIIKAEYVKDYIFKIWFYDGVIKTVDLKSFFDSDLKSIKKFSTPEKIKQFYLDGDTICWGDNECDIDPNSIYNGEYDIK